MEVEAGWEARFTGQAADVLVALFENGLVTPVHRGENARRTLTNDYVVRVLHRAFSLPANRGARRSEHVSLELKKEWDVSQMGVAAFLQSPRT